MEGYLDVATDFIGDQFELFSAQYLDALERDNIKELVSNRATSNEQATRPYDGNSELTSSDANFVNRLFGPILGRTVGASEILLAFTFFVLLIRLLYPSPFDDWRDPTRALMAFASSPFPSFDTAYFPVMVIHALWLIYIWLIK